MRTLDEVIAELEDEGLFHDALHYLKDMKNLERDYDILYNKYWREFNQQQTNPPLTWDELKTMEGKPVWVVTGTKGGRWGMFDGVWAKDNEDCVMFVYGHRKYAVCKIRLLGKTWQAYRKERS